MINCLLSIFFFTYSWFFFSGFNGKVTLTRYISACKQRRRKRTLPRSGLLIHGHAQVDNFHNKQMIYFYTVWYFKCFLGLSGIEADIVKIFMNNSNSMFSSGSSSSSSSSPPTFTVVDSFLSSSSQCTLRVSFFNLRLFINKSWEFREALFEILSYIWYQMVLYYSFKHYFGRNWYILGYRIE